MYGVDKNKPETMKYNPEVGKIVATPHIQRLQDLIDDATKPG